MTHAQSIASVRRPRLRARVRSVTRSPCGIGRGGAMPARAFLQHGAAPDMGRTNARCRVCIAGDDP
jgi:hypothetical protein